MRTGYLLMLVALSCLTSCSVPTGPTQRETRSIDRDTSEILRAELRMSAGSLKVAGGSPGWMQGDFAYNVPDWKPNIQYSSTAGHGALRIEQPSASQIHLKDTTNEWDIRLNNEIPTDLTARLGAGEAKLDLGSLTLRSLEIDMGAGELRLDLRGAPKRSYEVRIRGGVGEATVHLPRDVGVYAKAKGGLGEIKVEGLRAEGEHWVNDAYGTSKVNVHVDVRGGVGAINLIAE